MKILLELGLSRKHGAVEKRYPTVSRLTSRQRHLDAAKGIGFD
jgi:hypothetical protein